MNSRPRAYESPALPDGCQISQNGINDQGTIIDWVEGFILDRHSRGLSPGTIEYYRKKLKTFMDFFQGYYVSEITPRLLREYIQWLESTGHNKGGVATYYKAVRAFLRWYQSENDISLSPLDKVQGPSPSTTLMDPADIKDIQAMLKYCNVRDRTIILFLLDTGLRAAELLSLTINNVNPVTGVVQVLHGKGDKPRAVYIGRKTRQVLRKHLLAKPTSDYLFTDHQGEPLTYWGLRQVIRRRAEQAGIKPPAIHSFRRLFALTMLRNGVDIYSLQLLMGHADLQILRRYLKLNEQDTLSAHAKGSPVDSIM